MTNHQMALLASAVNRWLAFQVLCGRDALLSEAYLSQPVGEFLIHHHSGSFEPEHNHPVLNRPGPGRPKQIDFCLLTKRARTLDVALECKWVGETKYDKQRILNDLLRLECVHVKNRYVRRYLLVAGLKEDFFPNFVDLVAKDDQGKLRRFTRRLLSGTKNKGVTVDILNCPVWQRAYYRAFAKSFKAKVPYGFGTKLVARAIAGGIYVYLWRVHSSKHRTVFKPSVEWKS